MPKAPPRRLVTDSCKRTFFCCGLLCATPWLAAWDQPEDGRLRLTETSVTETGRDRALPAVKVQTKGYGLSYIASWGGGLAYTTLVTDGTRPDSSVRFRHQYLDASYTAGTSYLLTAGGGMGTGGTATIRDSALGVTGGNIKINRARSLFVGPGYTLGWLELYWIYRRNWVDAQQGSVRHALDSRHYQLGIGIRL